MFGMNTSMVQKPGYSLAIHVYFHLEPAAEVGVIGCESAPFREELQSRGAVFRRAVQLRQGLGRDAKVEAH